jgi:hypothetical protein
VLGGLIAQVWGLTAPWWFAFVGAGITLVLVWRSISHITAAPSVLDDTLDGDARDEVQANEP